MTEIPVEDQSVTGVDLDLHIAVDVGVQKIRRIGRKHGRSVGRGVRFYLIVDIDAGIGGEVIFSYDTCSC
jgi:hypothetical protein